MTPRDYDLRSIQPRSKLVALRWLGAGALACASLSAHALYTNGSTPPGFTTFAGQHRYSAEHWVAKKAATTTTVNVAGRTVTLNAMLRMAPSAGAAAVAFTRANPALLAATVVGTYLYNTYGFKADAQGWYKDSPPPNANHLSYNQAMAAYGANGTPPATTCANAYNLTTKYYVSGTSTNWGFTAFVTTDEKNTLVGAGWMWVNNCSWAHVVMSPQRTAPGTDYPMGRIEIPQSQWDTVDAVGFPDSVMDEIGKHTPLPVDLPVINPGPGDFPTPQVRRIPLGDFSPYPAPNSTTSTQFRAPILDLVGSPTQAEPWRVDAQPKEIVKDVPNGEPAPTTPAEPTDVPTDDPAQTEPTEPGLCDKYPDILACQKPELDTPEDDIPKSDKNISFTPESLFGGGSCPANPGWSDALGNHELDLQPVCDITSSVVRPLVLAMAALAALFIIAPFRTET